MQLSKTQFYSFQTFEGSEGINELKKQEIKPKENDLSNIKNFINMDIDKIYSKLTEDEKRVLWISVIDKIYVEDGKIKEVTFL